MANGIPGTPEIKLCYVTPEKIANSKKFKTALDKLFRVKKLARFVIDEAHCVSDHGHDFRPDYQKLNVLRQLYPKVPILALSATCPPAVLKDVLDTLRMPGLTRSASAAEPKKTVLFNTPLYRKNLHYAVHPKPAAANDSIAAMRDYILVHHKNDTGIVYCLTKKDCESVAKMLNEMSAGAIKTGVYHADVGDARKEALHKQWREGRVKVVCATIAFGLGIDKGDVRFVIHHSLSKSLDGFYQESGRAGRDGKDADCILYYRPQDGMRISSLACDERHGQEKALAMMAFASDLVECRKIQFAKYFNKSSKLSLKSWEIGQEDARTPCGHCDNCTRPADTLERAGVRGRVAAWQVLRVAEDTRREVTLTQLCDLARGLGSSAAASVGKGKGRAKEKLTVDLERVAGGKVELSKEHTEALCVRLLVEGYFAFSFQQTAYSVNVYLQPSATAGRFTRFTKDEIEQGSGPAFDCVFLKKPGRKGVSGSGAAAKVAEKTKATRAGASRTAAAGSSNGVRGKRKRENENETSFALGAEDSEESEDDGDDDGDDMRDFVVSDSDPIEEDEDEEWHTSLRGDKGKGRASIAEPQAKRPRKSGSSSGRSKPVSRTGRTVRDQEVIDISSD
ncbi:transporter [Ganoderma sinense ZZ0214-1]|uniref:ATP-dependent DNA helicase n=1 Tax=Ganoderma sinense ZZ0214-1 TaxID=1077348 RepID=A0A2G8S3C7_9APHY|nr:transporter [Ganoderma sinense ZZ0214-1]